MHVQHANTSIQSPKDELKKNDLPATKQVLIYEIRRNIFNIKKIFFYLIHFNILFNTKEVLGHAFGLSQRSNTIGLCRECLGSIALMFKLEKYKLKKNNIDSINKRVKNYFCLLSPGLSFYT